MSKAKKIEIDKNVIGIYSNSNVIGTFVDKWTECIDPSSHRNESSLTIPRDQNGDKMIIRYIYIPHSKDNSMFIMNGVCI